MVLESKIKIINDLKSSSQANCWGATQFALGVLDSPIWQKKENMEEFLLQYCENIKTKDERAVGDIMAIFDMNGELLHTALYCGKSFWWHKCGYKTAEVSFESEIKNKYDPLNKGIIQYKVFNKVKWLKHQSSMLKPKNWLNFFTEWAR